MGIHNIGWGTRAAFGSSSENMRKFRTGEVKSMAYTDADREAQTKAGAAPDSITATVK